ncbi:hypothetical protein NM208_g6727 [Fusarium decemcellulare]|uniref:Uncharacterized protein n=1 Tax=Fusarium decemcellulare TaxID=57161 RepID=A0ACC1SC51_9HYPO|nr:hypothetical protein NM208_g6727 [Fusarium decemcellulare]
MPTLETYNGYPLWHYIPSLPAAGIFTGVFALLTLGHSFRMFRHRMWFCIPFVVGGVFEVIGYIGRVLAYENTGELLPYIIHSTFVLLAPVLFAASLYMTLSRIIRSVNGTHCSIIPPRWLTRIFVLGDVVSFIIQGTGAGLRVQAGQPDSDIDRALGNRIIIGSLVFQLIIFGIYVVTAWRFNIVFGKDSAAARSTIAWKASLYMLYATSIMVMVRNIFRVVEYAMGSDSYLFTVEWGVYVFDAVLMAVTMALFLWYYPSQLKLVSKSDENEIELGPATRVDSGNSSVASRVYLG